MGSYAREASDAAIAEFRRETNGDPGELLQAMHLALRPTRGAAVAIADIDLAQPRLAFRRSREYRRGRSLERHRRRSLVSLNGTVGHSLSRTNVFEYPFPPGAHLVMHSDGLQSRWSLDAYPGVLHRDPTTDAALLYRDFARGRDDVTVFVAREAAEP